MTIEYCAVDECPNEGEYIVPDTQTVLCDFCYKVYIAGIGQDGVESDVGGGHCSYCDDMAFVEVDENKMCHRCKTVYEWGTASVEDPIVIDKGG